MRRKKMSRKVVGLYSNLKHRPLEEQLERLSTGRQYRDPDFVHAYLVHLDDLRYGKPAEAARLAAATGTYVVPELRVRRRQGLTYLAHSLGVFGSARRVQGKLDLARWATMETVRLARQELAPADLASLLQRACYVVGDFGEYEEAEFLAREAMGLYSDVADFQGMAKAMVDRGTMLRRLRRLREASTCNLMAISIISADEHRYRAAAYFNLGLIQCERKRLKNAVLFFEHARRLFRADNHVWHARLEPRRCPGGAW